MQAGAGNVIGSVLGELRDIIDLVENKDRIGVCLDTCEFVFPWSASALGRRTCQVTYTRL